jgi:hypothetical protein
MMATFSRSLLGTLTSIALLFSGLLNPSAAKADYITEGITSPFTTDAKYFLYTGSALTFTVWALKHNVTRSIDNKTYIKKPLGSYSVLGYSKQAWPLPGIKREFKGRLKCFFPLFTQEGFPPPSSTLSENRAPTTLILASLSPQVTPAPPSPLAPTSQPNTNGTGAFPLSSSPPSSASVASTTAPTTCMMY